MLPERDQLARISAELEGRSPRDILNWASEVYGDRLAMATAFGAEGCVIISMLSGLNHSVYLFNLETGYQFPETLDVRDRIQQRYGVEVHLVSAAESVQDMEHRFGGPIYGADPDKCCHIRKVVPLRETLNRFDAWITGIRRDQSPTRAGAPIVSWDGNYGLVKINPLANWTKKDVWRYIVENDVPYNTLHDQGFASIGCWPCTSSAGSDGDERSGRWRGQAKTECGIHVPTLIAG